MDARGNSVERGIDAQCLLFTTPSPTEQLAFRVHPEKGETDFEHILSKPLDIVAKALESQATKSWQNMMEHLPDAKSLI
jgi:hypothetical protein